MSISRKIHELWEACQACDPPIDVFRNEDVSRLQRLTEYSRVTKSLELQTENSHLTIMLALRSLAVQQHELIDRLSNTELVLTVPKVTSTTARPTLFVIREMIESAQIEVVLAGYRITNNEILDLLHAAARRGVRVVMLCGRADNDAKHIIAKWPSDASPPQLYQDVEDASDTGTLMHIKALLVDSAQLLVSSANFTFSGMARNIEFGVRTTGQAAIEAKTVLAQLMKSQLCECIHPKQVATNSGVR